MVLAVPPPIAPMLARLTRELPRGDLTYEPKWDGFRCLAFLDDAEVDLRSRHDRPLARYFPELVEAFTHLRAAAGSTLTLDGEIVLESRPGGVRGDGAAPGEFADLMSRLHPAASRVERLSRETPARYIAFDLLGDGGTDLRRAGYPERRTRLERLFELSGIPDRIALTPATRDPALAAHWFGAADMGIDGVVAKADDLTYEPGRRSMIKVKLDRSADCVLAGWRPLPGGAVSSLLLGLYDAAAELRHVGVVTQLPTADRIAFARDFARLEVALDEHPWRNGFLIGQSPLGRLKGSAARWTPDMEHDWVPLRPERVVEVGYDQVDADRFRHPARFRRWRPDRTAESCRLEQITGGAAVPSLVAAER